LALISTVRYQKYSNIEKNVLIIFAIIALGNIFLVLVVPRKIFDVSFPVESKFLV